MNKKIMGGVWGGLAGGVVMGLLMTMIMTPVMIAISKLWGFNSLPAGWFVQLVNSVIIGVLFALVFGKLVKGVGSGIGWGLLYGVIWWILGPLFLMPLWLTGEVAFASAFTGPGMQKLMVHLIYGLILGWIYAVFVKKAETAKPMGA